VDCSSLLAPRMTDEPLNCNSSRLCKCVKSMLALSSMNDAFWIMARDKPSEFIQFVEENLIEIQGEFEGHFKQTAVFPRFLRQNEKTDLRTGQTFTNKIGFIKMVRTLSRVNDISGGWGLADSKNFVENLPKDYRMFFFNSIEEAMSSKFARCCLDFGVDVEWVSIATTDGLIHYDFLKNKDIY
jgi:hypothetical protein